MHIDQQLQEIRRKDARFYELAMLLAVEPTKEAAIERLGYSDAWYYKLPADIRQQIDDCAAELRVAPVERGLQRMRDQANKVVDIFEEGLEHPSYRVRADAARDLGDRIGLRVRGGVDVSLINPAEQFADVLSEVYSSHQPPAADASSQQPAADDDEPTADQEA